MPFVLGALLFGGIYMSVFAGWAGLTGVAAATAAVAGASAIGLGVWRRRSAAPPHGAPVVDALRPRLRRAVEQGDIVAHYQPIVEVATGRVVGAEALARWSDAPEGLERPGAFLAVARRVGLMGSITAQVLEQVCVDFADGAVPDSWWVAVNLGPEEVVSPGLTDLVRSALARSGLAPERLVVEVSERIVPEPAAARALERLVTLGVRLAIDDFGSGWSTLAQLRSLPVELVKVDRSVVTEAVAGVTASPTGTRGSGLLHAVAALAEALGLSVLAEGIETDAELVATRDAGIDLGQGFHWGAAVPLEELIPASGSGGNAPSACDDGARARLRPRLGRR